jgi:hypothetical protein
MGILTEREFICIWTPIIIGILKEKPMITVEFVMKSLIQNDPKIERDRMFKEIFPLIFNFACSQVAR